jgi:hypothetical protein
MLTDNDAEHLAEIIHARRTAARALETSGRALEGGSARARSWSYFPPPRPPQGPPDPAWLGIVTLGRAVPRLCCWGLWGSGTDYARSPILFLWHRVRWWRTCASRAGPCGGEWSDVGFETEVLTQEANLSALTDLSGRWIDRVHARRPVKGIVLDMDSRMVKSRHHVYSEGGGLGSYRLSGECC